MRRRRMCDWERRVYAAAIFSVLVWNTAVQAVSARNASNATDIAIIRDCIYRTIEIAGEQQSAIRSELADLRARIDEMEAQDGG